MTRPGEWNSSHYVRHGRDSSLSEVTGWPVFSYWQSQGQLQTSSGSHPASHLTGSGTLYLGCKTGWKLSSPLPSSVEVKNTWISISTSPYAIIAWCLRIENRKLYFPMWRKWSWHCSSALYWLYSSLFRPHIRLVKYLPMFLCSFVLYWTTSSPIGSFCLFS
jgi:hypothetical protein